MRLPLILPWCPKMRRKPPKGDERHLLFFPRFKPHAGSGGNVETHAPRLFAIERESAIHLEEMIMAAHLNRAVAGVAHENSCLRAPLIGDDQVPIASKYSPGIINVRLSLLNRVVDGNKFGSVGERGFHLDIVDHFRYAFHYIGALQYGSAESS